VGKDIKNQKTPTNRKEISKGDGKIYKAVISRIN
jgi:hypothetical protein